jgi:hypothetical protein
MYENIQMLDRPERKLLWLETLNNDLLSATDPLPPSYKFQYVHNPERATQLLDRNYNVFGCTKPDLICNLMCIYDEFGFIKDYNINPDKLQCFFWIVASNYFENPFHNFRHGFSVT